uniref:Peptidase S1 domain-containing protein n=1 Tax=Trichuris muris TaxID=70415 RepID=A0A5S6QF85_TRIMR
MWMLVDEKHQGVTMVFLITVIAHSAYCCGVPAIPPVKEPQKTASNRIVNGWEATPHSLPWMVFMLVAKGSLFVGCGGFLIENGMENQTDAVLTAAHCLHYKNMYHPPGKIHLLVGAHNVHDFKDCIKQRVRNYATSFYSAQNEDNDIAMLRLWKPVMYNDHVRPLCLPKANIASLDTSTCFAAGWGETQHKTVSSTLKMTRLLVLPDSLCSPSSRLNRVFCVVQYYKGYNTCNGDSGSPLFCEIGGRYVAVGILSLGALNCTENVASSYVRLDQYSGWIESSLRELRRAPDQMSHVSEESTLYLPKQTKMPGSFFLFGGQHTLQGSEIIALMNGYRKRPTA